jgi:signal peptidase II
LPESSTEPARPPAPTVGRVLLGVAVFFVAVAAMLTVDLWSKSASWHAFVADEVWRDDGRVVLVRTEAVPVHVVPHGLDLTAVANQGAALGLGQGKKVVFLSVSVVAVVVLLVFLGKTYRDRQPSTRGEAARVLAFRGTLALLLAGVAGNFYDRLVFGYVRDMLHAFPRVRWSSLWGGLPDVEVFPWVFNVADVYLCVGVGAMLIFGFFAPLPEDEKPTKSKA